MEKDFPRLKEKKKKRLHLYFPSGSQSPATGPVRPELVRKVPPVPLLRGAAGRKVQGLLLYVIDLGYREEYNIIALVNFEISTQVG